MGFTSRIHKMILLLILLYVCKETCSVRYEIVHALDDKDFYNLNKEGDNILNRDLEYDSAIKEIYDKHANENEDFRSNVYGDQNNLYSVEMRKSPVEYVKLASFKNDYNGNEPYTNLNDKFNYINDYEPRTNKRNDPKHFYKFNRPNKNIIGKDLLLKNSGQQLYYDCFDDKKHVDKTDFNQLRHMKNANESSGLLFENRQKFLSNAVGTNLGTWDSNEYEESNRPNNRKHKRKEKTGKDEPITCKKDKTNTLISSLEKYDAKILPPKPNQGCVQYEENVKRNKSKQRDKDLGILTPVDSKMFNMGHVVINKEHNYLNKGIKKNNKQHNKKLPLKSVQNIPGNNYKEVELDLQATENNGYPNEDMEESESQENIMKSKPYIKPRHDNRMQPNKHRLKIRNNDDAYVQQISLPGDNDYQSKMLNSDIYKEPEKIDVKLIQPINYNTKHISSGNIFTNMEREESSNNFLSKSENFKVQNDNHELIPPSILGKTVLNSDVNRKDYVNAKEDKAEINLNKDIKINPHHFNKYFDPTSETKILNDHNLKNSEPLMSKTKKYILQNEEQHKPQNDILYYANDLSPLNYSNNATFLNLDSSVGNSVDMNQQDKYKNSETVINYDPLIYKKYNGHSKIEINNESSNGSPKLNNHQNDIFEYMKSKTSNSHGKEEHRKRSILNGDNDDIQSAFIDRHADYTDKDDEMDSVAPSKSNKGKTKKTNYDYDSENAEETESDHNVKENRGHKNEFKDKDRPKQSSDIGYPNKKSHQGDSSHKKKTKQTDNKNAYAENDTKSNRKPSNSDENYKSKKKVVESTNTESKEDLGKVTPAVSYVSSKKYTESGKVKLRERVSVKPVEKQCHPPAGPPKFKWCSEDSELVRDQEYEDTLRGRVALRIVEVILAKVHKSSKMTYDFGFCKNSKKTGCEEESTCEPQNSILKSQDLKEIMAGMERLSCKSCNQLPPKLKEFLEWLIKVKSVRSIHIKENPFGKHSNCSLGDSAFLFHRYGSSLPYENVNANNNQASYYNSAYETDSNCNYDQISKAENILSENNELINDVGLIREPVSNAEQNDLLLEEQKQLYNEKYKRYADEKEFNYPDNIINDEFKLPPSRNHFQKDNLYSNEYKGGENNYDYYMPKPTHSLAKEQLMLGRDLQSLKSNADNMNTLYSKRYDKKYADDIAIEQAQYKEKPNYKFDMPSHNYEDFAQTRKKRNQNKLQMEEIMIDKQPELDFVQINHENINDDLNKIINEEEKPKDILDESDQQLGFYTPVVFRIPDDYEMV